MIGKRSLGVEGVEIRHFVPGRLRLKVNQARGDAAFSEQVRNRLGAVPGIEKVEVNETTGSVLLRYDRKKIAEESSLDALSEAMVGLFPGMDTGKWRVWIKRSAQ